MKRSLAVLAIVAAIVLAAPAMLAQQQQGQSQSQTERIEAEVVAVDANSKTITFKPSARAGETGQTGEKASAQQTLMVEGAAASALQDLKPGDKVTITCRVNERGEKKVVEISKAGAQK